MKTKHLLIAGMAALALLGNSAGTASAQTPGGTDSTLAANLSVSMFQYSMLAIQEAGNSGDAVEYAIAYDIYVLSYLTFAIVDGYNSGTFDLSDFLDSANAPQYEVDAGVGFELALVVSVFAINLQNVGNSFGSPIQFFAELIQTDLQSAIVNDD
jgi:hypothetical protein